MHGSAQLRHKQKLRRSRACLLAPAPTYWRLSFTLASTFRTTRFLTEADLPMGQVTGHIDPRDGSPSRGSTAQWVTGS